MTSRAESRFPGRSISSPDTSSVAEASTTASPHADPSVNAPTNDSNEASNLEAIYESHAEFVWLTMQRLGVRKADLDDLCHDAFVVVHARLAQYEPNGSLRSWLFAICVRLAANYRRKAYVRLERSVGSFEQGEAHSPVAPPSASPDRVFAQRETARTAQQALDTLPLVQRVVFMMFEVEGLDCQQIAVDLGVPLGTVYSRLHAARNSFRAEAKRLLEGEGRE